MDKLILGCDVSKLWLDLAQHGACRIERMANDQQAVTAWLQALGPQNIAVVAYEPTGGYERALLRACAALGVPTRRVHPRAVAAWRTAQGISAKTDRIDARLIADFAAQVPAQATPVQQDATLKALVARRRQIRDMLQAERCRLDLAEPALRDSHERLIGVLEDELRALERATKSHIAETAALQELADALMAVDGVGPVTAATLLGELPELGHVGPKSIASLVGLAPRTRQSGKSRTRASIGHGRIGVRQVLFNAARAALRSKGRLRAFFDRLVERGKPGKVAFTAVMRKLLTILNAIARDTLMPQAAEARA